MITENTLNELHECVNRIVRVWADGKFYSCSPEVQASGELVLRLRVSTDQPAIGDAGIELHTFTEEQIPGVLEHSRRALALPIDV
jgi:hypothetical protein